MYEAYYERSLQCPDSLSNNAYQQECIHRAGIFAWALTVGLNPPSCAGQKAWPSSEPSRLSSACPSPRLTITCTPLPCRRTNYCTRQTPSRPHFSPTHLVFCLDLTLVYLSLCPASLSLSLSLTHSLSHLCSGNSKARGGSGGASKGESRGDTLCGN